MEISSASYLIDPVEFGLGKLQRNKEFLEKLRKKYGEGKQIETWKGLPLVEFKKSSKDYYIMLLQDDAVLYMVHVQTQSFKQLPGRQATQVQVWSSLRDRDTVQGLAKHVFQNILLKRYKYIVSDNAQSPDGKRFWIGQLFNAIRANFKVGVFDEDETEVAWYDRREEDFDTWMERVEKYAWGTSFTSHEYIRLVIGR